MLTEQVQKNICNALAGNQTLQTASALAGVRVRAVREWLEKGAADDAIEPYASFHMKVLQALAMGEGRLVQTVTGAAERDPKIALALLEKRYRDEWGKTEKVDHTVNGGKPLVIELAWPGGGGDTESEIAPPENPHPLPELEGGDDIVDAEVVPDEETLATMEAELREQVGDDIMDEAKREAIEAADAITAQAMQRYRQEHGDG